MREPTSSNPTSEQKRDICLVLSLGCDRETAFKYVGWSLEELRREMLRDQAFAAELRRAEAASELMHMRNVQNAARDEKHWRASVWWLERRAPERYGRRAAETVTLRQLESFVALLVSAVTDEVQAVEDRQRLLTRLQQIADALDELSQGDIRVSNRPPCNTMLPSAEDVDADMDDVGAGGDPMSDDNS
jgi:hypothetical protein